MPATGAWHWLAARPRDPSLTEVPLNGGREVCAELPQPGVLGLEMVTLAGHSAELLADLPQVDRLEPPDWHLGRGGLRIRRCRPLSTTAAAVHCRRYPLHGGAEHEVVAALVPVPLVLGDLLLRPPVRDRLIRPVDEVAGLGLRQPGVALWGGRRSHKLSLTGRLA